jgi:DNA-binding transcriptional regulator YbjK
MSTQTDPDAAPRTPLSRQRVLRAAVALADRGGVGALSMRKLAQEIMAAFPADHCPHGDRA